MRTKVTVACALAAFVVIAGGTAEATGLIHTSGIAKGAVTLNRLSPGVQKMVKVKAMPGKDGVNGATGLSGVNGINGADGPMGLPGKPGAAGGAGASGVDGSQGDKGDKGSAGWNGTNGQKGDKGDKGDTGVAGAPGTPGTNGVQGTNGAPGAKGDKGDAGDLNRQYGAAKVLVSRNGGPASVWATYSTLLGSAYGDTTSGSFRFTCSGTVNCTISVQGSVTAGAAHGLYPRLMVYVSGPTGGAGPISMCEYADGGVTNVALPNTPVTLNIGGSADCNAQPVVPIGNGDVSSIVVPAGNYYDVLSTFTFLP